jgi:hypothetical protein
MGLKEVLSKMRLVEIDESPASPAPAPAVRGALPALGPGRPRPPVGKPVDIEDLLRSVPATPEIDEKTLKAESGGGDDVPDFPAIYKAAGISEPVHGYTAYKVLEIFASPGFAGLDLRAKAAALTGFLNMNPAGAVPVTEIVADAVRRDQALDKFEEFMRNKLAQRSAQVEKENSALQAEIDELIKKNREKMEANRLTLETEQAKIARWQIAKRAEERKLFDAVNPFVESNPITAGSAGSAGSAGGAGRPAPAPVLAPEPPKGKGTA